MFLRFCIGYGREFCIFMGRILDEVAFIFTIRRNVAHCRWLRVILGRHSDILWVQFLHLFLQFSTEPFLVLFLPDG